MALGRLGGIQMVPSIVHLVGGYGRSRRFEYARA